MDIHSIVTLKKNGASEREIAGRLRIDRKTVRKYWNIYKENQILLSEEKDPVKRAEIQEAMIAPPKYKSSKRGTAKKTPEFYAALKGILDAEAEKERLLGWKKQNLNKTQIHELMRSKGFNVGYTTVVTAINEIKGTGQECYVKQKYDFGDRLEYDFGEVHLQINGKRQKYFLAVLGSPASTFRWCYLYDNCKKDVFLDSHVRFFEMIGGVWKEVVYDNMKNVVTKFIGRSEKELNTELLQLSMYYGFDINVTNAFSGNEKGYVESSVRYLRNKIFAEQISFESKEAAICYMERRLIELNEDSRIEVEKNFLTQAPPPFELADITKSKVDKCSFIHVKGNLYSVPEYLVNKWVVTKIYRERLLIYSNNTFVCSHPRKKDGQNEVSADIRHYLKTLTKKPGALKNSAVLKSNPKLYSLYNTYYSKKPKDFIRIISEHKDQSDEKIIEIIKFYATKQKPKKYLVDTQINQMARKQTNLYKNLIIGVDE